MQTFNTLDDLANWVEENVNYGPHTGHDSAVEAAEWFVAYTEAGRLFSDSTLKDDAYTVLHGLVPIKDNPDNIALWLECEREMFDTEVETDPSYREHATFEEEMEATLRDFWHDILICP